MLAWVWGNVPQDNDTRILYICVENKVWFRFDKGRAGARASVASDLRAACEHHVTRLVRYVTWILLSRGGRREPRS